MSAERDDAEIREQYQRLRQQDERLGRPLETFLPLDTFRRAVRPRAGQRPAASRRRPRFRQRLAAAALGLAIVHRIVADHHGSIRVEDNHPRGTVFTVELPGA